MRKAVSFIAMLLGAALLVFAIALPTYVVPKGKVLPLDVVSTTKTEVLDSNLLDSAALAKDRPVGDNGDKPECRGKVKQISCFIWKDLPVQNQSFTVAQEPSDDKRVTLEAGGTTFRKDLPEPRNLISAQVDRVTLDRKTQMPVPDPISTIDIAPPASQSKDDAETSPAFTRDGIQYQFPMGTDKKSYPYFDKQIMKSAPIEFVREEKVRGNTAYRFEQTIEPTEMYPEVRRLLESDGELSDRDESALSSLRLTFPAKVWGLKDTEIHDNAVKKDENADKADKDDKAAEDKAAESPEGKKADEDGVVKEEEDATNAEGDKPDADKKDEKAKKEDDKGPDVEMSRYYTVKRSLLVEPETGVIVDGAEEVWMYYAQDAEEAREIAQPENRERELSNPQRTALYFPAKWDDASRDGQWKKAQEGLDTIKKMGTILPWVLGIVGVVLIIFGFMFGRRRSR